MLDHDEERFLRDVAASAPPVPPASPDLDARIMAAVHRAARSRPRAVLSWFTAPLTVRVSPAWGLAAGAVLIAAALLLPRGPRSPGPTPGAAAAFTSGDSVLTMRFVLAAPEAASVSLVGDFNHWSPHATPLRPAGAGGVWIVDVPLAPGRHEYAFILDGERWVPDPAAPLAAAADFDTPNSVVTVIPEAS